jgi:hypothetical protein
METLARGLTLALIGWIYTSYFSLILLISVLLCGTSERLSGFNFREGQPFTQSHTVKWQLSDLIHISDVHYATLQHLLSLSLQVLLLAKMLSHIVHSAEVVNVLPVHKVSPLLPSFGNSFPREAPSKETDGRTLSRWWKALSLCALIWRMWHHT